MEGKGGSSEIPYLKFATERETGRAGCAKRKMAFIHKYYPNRHTTKVTLWKLTGVYVPFPRRNGLISPREGKPINGMEYPRCSKKAEISFSPRSASSHFLPAQLMMIAAEGVKPREPSFKPCMVSLTPLITSSRDALQTRTTVPCSI